MSASEMEPVVLVETAWRVGSKPTPWSWGGWEWASEGRFPGRWDDFEGNFRTFYAGSSRLGCLLEVLASFRKDPRLALDFADIVDLVSSGCEATLPGDRPTPYLQQYSTYCDALQGGPINDMLIAIDEAAE